ncbi:hypothetical protein CALVIDRAFT_147492 [Calocera viscosa TUFC12733]|uniref:Uncharacterized protein n=1 Tax=Calocera viscosa (strain TUFC12733) TaxID=1330018 RepID=A0A167LVD7_CALVF|nr:hypothetical protein CALVIDRAFT_147492 [Calocera viscosa TUFC12733]
MGMTILRMGNTRCLTASTTPARLSAPLDRQHRGYERKGTTNRPAKPRPSCGLGHVMQRFHSRQGSRGVGARHRQTEFDGTELSRQGVVSAKRRQMHPCSEHDAGVLLSGHEDQSRRQESPALGGAQVLLLATELQVATEAQQRLCLANHCRLWVNKLSARMYASGPIGRKVHSSCCSCSDVQAFPISMYVQDAITAALGEGTVDLGRQALVPVYTHLDRYAGKCQAPAPRVLAFWPTLCLCTYKT